MGTPSHQQLGLGVGTAVRKSFERNKIIMSLDVEEVKRICDIYDWHGKGVLDMYYFMDIFYAMGMNLTKKTCVKYGQTDDVEKKFLPFDEVVALAQQVVKEPEHTGNYHDFVELCKLYDKSENGTMMLAELETFLTLMGDEIPKEDCTKLWNPWLVLRMRMVSSLTLHSWTNCAASKSNKLHPRSYQKTFLKKYIISNSSKICVTTSSPGQKHGGPKKPTKKPKLAYENIF